MNQGRNQRLISAEPLGEAWTTTGWGTRRLARLPLVSHDFADGFVAELDADETLTFSASRNSGV